MKSMEQTIKEIAEAYLNLETLEERKSDSLDFSEQAVWNIKEALEKAWREGFEAAEKNYNDPKAIARRLINESKKPGGLKIIGGR